jgi:uncharacterized protein
LLERAAEFYRTRGTDLEAQGAALQHALDSMLPPAAAPAALHAQPLAAARAQLAKQFDPEHGGFGSAPKFPHPGNLQVLLRLWRNSADGDTPDLHCLYMVCLTLTRMAEGGLYDQLGGGFARYSVDRAWHIPHFEKMLYDNAQLLSLYAQAAAATGEVLFARIASDTADWLLREMRSAQGSFYASVDADSDGAEGRFYVWDREHLRGLLASQMYATLALRFGLDQPANFDGHWHLRVHASLEEVARATQQTVAEVESQLATARALLLAARAQRPAPARDEKVLTAWNALTAAALAQAARHLRRPELAAAARQALDFVGSQLWHDGRLLAVYALGRAHLPAYLDDHAFLLHAALELLQTEWRSADLGMAVRLAEILLQRFEDHAAGGFFFTADDHEALMHRPKPFADEALPAGTGLAALGLQRLGNLLGEQRYRASAERTLQAAFAALERYPHAHASLLIALGEQLDPPEVIIIRGEPIELGHWRDTLNQTFAPHRLVFAIPADAADLPAALASKLWPGHTVAYLCRGETCSAPISSLAALMNFGGVSTHSA